MLEQNRYCLAYVVTVISSGHTGDPDGIYMAELYVVVLTAFSYPYTALSLTHVNAVYSLSRS